MFIAHLHQRLRLYTIGWMNLNVVVHPHAPRSGRPIEAAMPEIIDKAHDIVLTDRRVKVHELVEAHHMVQWFQFCTNNWVWKSYRQDGCRICSLWIISATVWRFQNNVWRCFNIIHISEEFLRLFITVDETWIHYFTPETKEQSKQWTSPDEPAPKKAKTVKSAGKATVFWDARGIIHINYLPSSRWSMITTQPYWTVLTKF